MSTLGIRAGGRPRREPPRGELKKPRPVWFVTLMAFVLPGSGQVFNGAPIRGIVMQFAMLFCAFITYQMTKPQISLIGRLAGGLLVYVFSIVDANGIAQRRVNAWAHIDREQAGKPGKRDCAAAKRAPGAGHGKSAGRGASSSLRPAGRREAQANTLRP
jgi:hypothetical protein